MLFANDTHIFQSGFNVSNLCNEISIEVCKLSIWFNVIKLSLNVAKTHFWSLDIPGNKNICVKIMIDEKEIERVAFTKFIGVLIDEKLNWSQHIDSVKKVIQMHFSYL